MTIWLLAIILVGALVAIGYTQGAIRVGISFLGIILATLLAFPLAKLFKPAVAALGVSDLLLLWILPPAVAFLLVSAVVKVGAFALHHKVDVYYKYKAGDLRLALWERLNARLGACLGALNGLAYLVVISWLIWVFSYPAVQLSTGDADARALRILSRLGRDLQATGLAKVARALDRMPASFYEASDLAGLLFHNSLLEARLSRYPAFLPLAERPEYKAIGQDNAFAEMRLRRGPVGELLANPNVAVIANSKDQLTSLWRVVEPDMQDLNGFLATGVSQKYPEAILGRWYFDINAAMAAYRRIKPTLPSAEMKKFRSLVSTNYARTSFVIMPGGEMAIKSLPQVKGGVTEIQSFASKWKSTGNDYEINLGTLGERRGKIEAGRLVLPGSSEGLTLIFSPED